MRLVDSAALGAPSAGALTPPRAEAFAVRGGDTVFNISAPVQQIDVTIPAGVVRDPRRFRDSLLSRTAGSLSEQLEREIRDRLRGMGIPQ